MCPDLVPRGERDTELIENKYVYREKSAVSRRFSKKRHACGTNGYGLSAPGEIVHGASLAQTGL